MRFGRRCAAAAATAGASAPARRTTFAPRYCYLASCSHPFSSPIVPTRSLSLLPLLPVRFVSLYSTKRPLSSLSFPPLVSYRSCSRSPALCSPTPSAVSPVTSSSHRRCGGASSRLYVVANPATHTTPLFEPSRRLLSPDTHAEMCSVTTTTSTTTTSAVTASTTATTAADSQRCPRRRPRPRPRRLC